MSHSFKRWTLWSWWVPSYSGCSVVLWKCTTVNGYVSTMYQYLIWTAWCKKQTWIQISWDLIRCLEFQAEFLVILPVENSIWGWKVAVVVLKRLLCSYGRKEVANLLLSWVGVNILGLYDCKRKGIMVNFYLFHQIWRMQVFRPYFNRALGSVYVFISIHYDIYSVTSTIQLIHRMWVGCFC